MPGLTWNAATSKCDVDELHAAQVAALPDVVPDDEAWKAFRPQQFMAPAKKIATSATKNGTLTFTGKSSLPGRFGNTEDEVAHDDQYMYENKDKIIQANKLAAEGLARGEQFEDIEAEIKRLGLEGSSR
jgi:hypothetical protein